MVSGSVIEPVGMFSTGSVRVMSATAAQSVVPNPWKLMLSNSFSERLNTVMWYCPMGRVGVTASMLLDIV